MNIAREFTHILLDIICIVINITHMVKRDEDANWPNNLTIFNFYTVSVTDSTLKQFLFNRVSKKIRKITTLGDFPLRRKYNFNRLIVLILGIRKCYI